MEPIQYVLMQPEDIEEAVKLEREIFSRPWTKENFEESIAREDSFFLAAKKEERLFGYCGCYQSFEEADITNVAVKASVRRQGIASGLFRELFRQGEKRGIMRYFLEVRVSNEAAVSLYAKFGFGIVGLRRNFYVDPTEDAYVMQLEIQPSCR